MKRFLFYLSILAISTISAFAQTQLGGTLSFFHTDRPALTSYSISPDVGFSLNPKWVLGLQLDIIREEEGTNKNHDFSVSPYVRYNAAEVGPLKLFAEGRISYLHSVYKSKDSDFSTIINDVRIQLRPGIIYPLCERLDFIAHLGSLAYSTDSKSLSFVFDVSSVNIGFVFKI
ncbi:MAG: hypothetical protein MJZ18_05160 [Bacteroidales bacterium]|nr:hypothetical protein [Bacteroidales bacterium]